MLYAILFGLDFYQSLITVFYLLTSVYVIGLIISITVVCINADFNFKYENAVKDNNEYYISMYIGYAKVYQVCRAFLKKWWIGVLVVLTFFAPSKDTVYIATGLYVGESVYNTYKDTPLAKKAYDLAEMKLNEMLDEKLQESNKK